MQDLLKPIKTESLKEVFVTRFEELILSGKLTIGQKLPSERELALQLGVSRPVVHEGLVDLKAKGLVTMRPRVGTVVNDYRKEGSLAMLTSLVQYHNGRLEPNLLQGMLEMRQLFEVETARLAALRRSEDHLRELFRLLKEEGEADVNDVERITGLDFRFHHLIAMTSGNMIYPLLLNSFKQVYTNLAGLFFSEETVVPVVFSLHREMVQDIKVRDEKGAADVMKHLLDHGEKKLKQMIGE